MRYLLTDSAKQDIRDITHHIRTVQKSPQNARLVAMRLKAQFAKLVCSRSLATTKPSASTTQ
jgi:plasmid stabilization system protein ParE